MDIAVDDFLNENDFSLVNFVVFEIAYQKFKKIFKISTHKFSKNMIT